MSEKGFRSFVVGATNTQAAREAIAAFRNLIAIMVDRDRSIYLRYGFTRTAGVIQKSGVVVIDSDATIRYIHRSSNPRKSFRKDEVLTVVDKLA